MKILIVDDEISEHNNAKDWAPKTLKKLKEDGKVDASVQTLFELDFAQSVEEAKSKKIEDIDLAVIDMELDKQRDNSGEDVVKYIEDLCLRIPVFIYTGTDTDISVKYYKKCIKGEDNFNTIFYDCFELEKTGLLDIVKKKGLLDVKILEIFSNQLLPSIKESNWLRYGLEDSSRTNKALLRYTLNHLMLYLRDNDDEKFFPEEVYLTPSSNDWRTGSILKKQSENKFFLIISPACDLAIHSGNIKTDCIQILEIEKIDEVIAKICRNQETKDNDKKRLFMNASAGYYHYLPPIKNFTGGFVNFRKIQSQKQRELRNDFEPPLIQVAPQFCKDLVSRFSSYYARQGQPVIEVS